MTPVIGLRVNRILGLTVAILAVIVAARNWPDGVVVAQTGTYTTNELVYNATAIGAGAPSLDVRNVGQASHWLYYCADATVTGIEMHLEASGTSTGTRFDIAQPATTLPCGVLEAGGYYPYVRARYANGTGTGNVTAFYSSSTAAIATNGLAQISKTPVVTTFSPALIMSDITVDATSGAHAIPTGAGGVVLGGYVENPNGTAIYFSISNLKGTGCCTGEFARMIPANSAIAYSYPAQGILAINTPVLRCSATFGGFTDPVSNCRVTFYYKTTITVFGKTSSGGASAGGQSAYP